MQPPLLQYSMSPIVMAPVPLHHLHSCSPLPRQGWHSTVLVPCCKTKEAGQGSTSPFEQRRHQLTSLASNTSCKWAASFSCCSLLESPSVCLPPAANTRWRHGRCICARLLRRRAGQPVLTVTPESNAMLSNCAAVLRRKSRNTSDPVGWNSNQLAVVECGGLPSSGEASCPARGRRTQLLLDYRHSCNSLPQSLMRSFSWGFP